MQPASRDKLRPLPFNRVLSGQCEWFDQTGQAPTVLGETKNLASFHPNPKPDSNLPMGSLRFDFGALAKRAFLPRHVATWARLKKSPTERSRNDAQLKLYSRVLGSPYLHFGYFDDKNIHPSEVSLASLSAAQARYAELLTSRVITLPAHPAHPANHRVIDAGCGLGGLSRTLTDKGCKVLSLTPDRNQVAWIREQHPDLDVVESKFEEFSEPDWLGTTGTLLMSESFQYMNIQRATDLASRLLGTGGRWIICDYFRTSEDSDPTGHMLDQFYSLAASRGFQIAEDIDLTPHVQPTLGFAKELGDRLLSPLLDFVEEKLETKKPKIHYVFDEFFGQVSASLSRELHRIDPIIFFKNRQYRLLVLEK